MLRFRLFQIGTTNFEVIFSRKLLNLSNCIHHHLPPLVTIKSHLGLEKQPRILDPITVLIATIFYSSRPHKTPIGLYHSPRLIAFLFFFVSIALHCIAFHFLYCIVLFCCTVHYCLFSFFDF